MPTPSYKGPVSRVEGKSFLVRTESGAFEPFFVKGVDIGAAKPGFWPGEFGITQEDYARWFTYIGQLHANTIRVYVPQMPAFYDALLAYNLTAKSPLYLMQGIYMNEELIVRDLDAYGGNGELIDIFQRDLRNTVDVIHGNAVVYEVTPETLWRDDAELWDIAVRNLRAILADDAVHAAANRAKAQKGN